MSARLKIIVAYDGSRFAGWQSQAHGDTVQDHLESAFRKITGHALRVHGASRTDAGVHALGQCAHVDLSNRDLTSREWRSALNASLPREICVLRAQFAPENFHARFSAKGKTYRYRIWNGAVFPPLEINRAWHVITPLDLGAMKKAARIFVGKHNFAAFAANRGKPEKDSVRTIRSLIFRRDGAVLALDFSGDGFLYRMVRLMVGALVRVGLQKLTEKEIADNLHAPPAKQNGPRFAAPAEGLFLLRVRY